MIKALAFDYGGVISINEGGNIVHAIADLLGVPYADFRRTYWKYNHLSNVHNASWEEVAIKTAREFSQDFTAGLKIKDLIKEHTKKSHLNAELLDLFPRFRKAGFKLAILSNATRELRKHLEEKGIIALVDEIIISGEIGYQKPSKEAFKILFDRLRVQPKEVVFVDDSDKSLETAGEIGYIPMLFTSNQKLLADLKNLGIEF